MCAVAMATGLVKIRLKNGFCLFKKFPVVRLCSSFAHYELILNPFYQNCNYDIGDFRNSPYIVFCIKIPYVKIQFSRSRSFTWFLNYFFAKFLEVLTTGSLEIGKSLQKQSVSIFRATVLVLHVTGFFR